MWQPQQQTLQGQQEQQRVWPSQQQTVQGQQ
jgi:hypothetical protein